MSLPLDLGPFLATSSVQHALQVGAIVAAVTGIVGVFTVLRGQSFAGHALADMGAVGGSGAFLIGLDQLWGFLVAGILAAVLMDAVGLRRLQGRDIATGVVFGAGTGLTALFLFWDTTIGGSSNAAIAVLFGSLFVIDPGVVPVVVICGVLALALIVIAYRWLLLETLDRDLAFARAASPRWAGTLFLVALALAVALSSLTIGAILSTALLIGPAATALRLTRRMGSTIALAAGLGVAQTWVGCWISYESYNWFGGHNWPVSFTIVALVFGCYLASRLVPRRRAAAARSDHGADLVTATGAVA